MIYRVGLVVVCVVCFLGTSLMAEHKDARLPMRNELGSRVPTNHHPKRLPNYPSLDAASFGFGCLYETSCGATWNGGNWITTESQPGLVRLWHSGTNWTDLETAANTYDWSHLDTWLDLLAANQPRQAMYTFGQVPCFIAGNMVGVGCLSGYPSSWSPVPPRDLGQYGSPTFNAFVATLVRHCSPAGNCVKTYIKYWELWNEPNLVFFWEGTPTQLYAMMRPAVNIIRANIPGAIVSTPPICGNATTWMSSWMTLENTKGRISDYLGFHVYMRDSEPEQRLAGVENLVKLKNTNGWTTTPWMNTETNWDNVTFQCSPNFTQEDCNGQVVRWHVMQYAYQGGAGGAAQINWYNWPSITNYDTYYYTMMQWLVGSTFSVSCTTTGNVWTCPMTESNGVSALIVWNATGDAQYTPAQQYVDYKEMNGTYGGTTVQISPGQSTTIGYVPIMFETAP